MALVEDQVDDGEHGGQPAGQIGLRRDAIGDARVPDLGLGPYEPLGHGRLGHQERMRDLAGGQAAKQPQRQRDLGSGRQRRVAAGEDEPQPVIAHRTLLDGLLTGVQQRRLGVLVRAGSLAAQPVDSPVARRRDDPPGRARRQPALRPPAGRLGERVGHRVFGSVDVAEDAGQDGYRPAVLRAEDTLDISERGRDQRQSPGMSTMGRTSTGSVQARVALPAQPSAASRSAARITQKPPMCSLPSA